ncbi:MAG TPA: polysaccharide biosynthesis protein [Clostridiaceae bacterium]|nr:polysaccharide biosynthesis protein [Clostridiaceae bacterium]
MTCDFIFVLLAFWFVNFSLRGLPGGVKALTLPLIFLLTVINIIIYWIGGLYNTLWAFTGTREVLQIGFVTLIASGVDLAIGLIIQNRLRYVQYIFVWITLFMFALALRMSYRLLRYLRDWLSARSRRAHRRVLVVGADEYGSILVSQMQDGRLALGTPVVILDDNRLKWNKRVHGVKVYGGIDKLGKVVRIYSIDEVVVASPNILHDQIKQIYDTAASFGCEVRVSQGLEDSLKMDFTGPLTLRELDLNDLVGRKEVQIDIDEIRGYIEHRTVLITGAGGSIGTEVARQVALYDPARIILFDWYENLVFELLNDLKLKFHKGIEFCVEIGSVQDKACLTRLFEKYMPSVVFHAAAHKHVPLMENNPSEAVKNNVFGTYNIASMSEQYGVERFVFISTDKSVNPTNVMGATKYLAERVVQTLAKGAQTRFACVRFGNVLGSAGSVIPIFRKQIKNGGPLTITNKQMVRYFMTINEAGALVIEAGSMAQAGEVYILRMGEPVRILDLAFQLIRMSGLEPYKDIDIIETGPRQGEKMYEELQRSEETMTNTRNPDIMMCENVAENKLDLAALFTQLDDALHRSNDEIKQTLQALVPGYQIDDRSWSGDV